MPDTPSSRIPDTTMDAVIEAFADACYDVGFAHGANHGISEVEEAKREATHAALLDLCAALQQEVDELERLPGFDHNDALQTLCRAFDDWEPIYEHWLDWYKPEEWIHMSRGFGAFLRHVLNSRNVDDEKRELLASLDARYKTIAELDARCAALQAAEDADGKIIASLIQQRDEAQSECEAMRKFIRRNALSDIYARSSRPSATTGTQENNDG